MTDEAQRWTRRAALPWRVATVLYALALTAATHWPALELGTPQQPAPDKVLHAFAFGGLALLLRNARWPATPWLAALAALAWAAADELTQALPGLRRTVSAQDFAASVAGIAVVAAWWWALAPLGGPANRARLAWQSFVVADLFARPGAWVVAGLGAAAGALVVGGVSRVALMYVEPEHYDLTVAVAATLLGALPGIHLAVAVLARRRAAALAGTRPCPRCAASCRDVELDEGGRGRCPACAAAVHAGQWAPPMQLPLGAALRGMWPAALLAGGLAAAGVLVYLAVVMAAPSVAVAADLMVAVGHLAPDLQLTIDVALLAAAIAAGARLYRSRQATRYDRQHLACRCCDQDLTGTAVTGGLGRCPECGTPFARFETP